MDLNALIPCQVQGLLAKIKRYEEQLEASPAGEIQPVLHERLETDEKTKSKMADILWSQSASHDYVNSASRNESSGMIIAENGPSPGQLSQSSQSSISQAERASGPAFERRVRSLLHSHIEYDRDAGDNSNVQLGLDAIEHPEPAPPIWTSTQDLLRKAHGRPDLPSEQDSHRLLGLFLSYMGVNQHYLDPRTFVDTMAELFQSPTSRLHQMKTMWFIQYLLIMAMGKLMDTDTETSGPHPGVSYFAEAMRLLPQQYELGSHGVISVEILCLVALYLQWCDRKHDAYLYVGNAVRLAIALGYPLPAREQQCPPSQKAHRNRVWWTAYMLDRRIAASLGLPVAADDRQFATELPLTSPGFASPDALGINVRIARATGDIMTSLYGNAAVTEMELVRNIQAILSSLYNTGHCIPTEYTVDFASSHLIVSRTAASLYLMLFQAIILCIRPVLLQRVKEKVISTLKRSPVPEVPVVIHRLCSTCKESASKSLRIVSALREQHEVARFGFFDLDQTFSAALTVIMIGFVDGTAYSEVSKELQQATSVLEYLSRAGNSSAEQRLIEIRNFHDHVWPKKSAGRDKTMASPTNRFDNTLPVLEHSSPDERPRQSTSTSGEPTSASQAPPTGDLGVQLEIGADYAFNLDLGEEADGIYSSFHDPQLPLTGVDHLDWAELEKVFASTQA
ncbi:hypothetical protein PFICI_00044 [Pestalotiopsis fici W106-1]|uniref:Xylanolytic transcriptional activator regulatory domain-containing protein n=1 Tax=Pestalotiopsis fici (strain W106-1 / CGMCC3.15140) TaxID=1229662 RepID=W3XLT9_PESFW|nr:uncharacterized protein PFICI_00044 [Pestalotiopsis fici W106-1]ETS86216.1 hypothetical protein PFICI_00044 [Pestalotiopsis fici W106-1]